MAKGEEAQMRPTSTCSAQNARVLRMYSPILLDSMGGCQRSGVKKTVYRVLCRILQLHSASGGGLEDRGPNHLVPGPHLPIFRQMHFDILFEANGVG